jgi:hypothetical protein
MQKKERKIERFSKYAAYFVYIICAVCILSAGVVFGQDKTAVTEGITPHRTYDFTGDVRTDFTVVEIGATGEPITWKTRENGGSEATSGQVFGIVGDNVTIVGDYIGDAKAEYAVFRQGTWYISPFGGGTTAYKYFGNPTGDNLGRVGDYDGDGKDDECVIRVVSNVLQWHIRNSSNGAYRVINFGRLVTGESTLAFQGADFTGDGREEIVVAQVVNGTGATTWHIADSLTGAYVLRANWGDFDIDFMVNPGDYTGDGKADLVAWRAGGAGADARYWYIRNTATGALVTPQLFGIGDPGFINQDLPVRGDYDGDGIDDIAVWRPTTGQFWWINSSNGQVPNPVVWGTADNDVPVANFFTF